MGKDTTANERNHTRGKTTGKEIHATTNGKIIHKSRRQTVRKEAKRQTQEKEMAHSQEQQYREREAGKTRRNQREMDGSRRDRPKKQHRRTYLSNHNHGDERSITDIADTPNKEEAGREPTTSTETYTKENKKEDMGTR